MTDEELEAIRKQKMEALLREREAYGGQAAEMEARDAEYEAQKAAALRQILTPDARERLARVGLARPEIAEMVEQQLISLAQSGRLRQRVDDKALQELLGRVMPERREIRIERR